MFQKHTLADAGDINHSIEVACQTPGIIHLTGVGNRILGQRETSDLPKSITEFKSEVESEYCIWSTAFVFRNKRKMYIFPVLYPL